MGWVALALAALALFGFYILFSDGDKRQALTDDLTTKAGEGEVLVKVPTASGQAIGLAIRDDAIFVATKDQISRYERTDIMEASVETDEATVSKVSRTSQAGGALAGAVIAGPVGAVIGGLSGSSRTSKAPPKDVRLRLVMDDTMRPIIDISFIEMTATGLTHGDLALREADEWLARLKSVIRQN